MATKANVAGAPKKAGRPKKAPVQVAPEQEITAPISTPNTSKTKVKRKTVSVERKDKVYVIADGKRGGIWCKVPQANITVFDEETQKVRELRYSPNENSVWADEQGDHIIREQIALINKMLTVPYTNPPLAKYLDLHPYNVANGGHLFKLVDTETDAKTEVDNEFLSLDAISMVRDKGIDELIPVAMALGIDTTQKNVEVKRELLREAKSNPQRFIRMFDDPTVKVKSVIMSACDFQILRADKEGLKWFDSGRLIVATPAGQDTVSIATRFCLSDKGALVFEEIEKQLSKI